MRKFETFDALLVSLTFLSVACSEANKSASVNFHELAEQGKQVFAKHECFQCHSHEESIADTLAPDLTRPFLANNDMLIEIHLNSLERSAMPPIELTEEEIRSVSYYIAGLHASSQQTVSEEKADARCPVCYAPVSAKKAKEKKLIVSYSGDNYYFECRECLEAFSRVPEAYLAQ